MLSFQQKQGNLDLDYLNKPGEFDYEEFVGFVEVLVHGSKQTESQSIERLTDLSLLQEENVGLIEVPPGVERMEIIEYIGRKLRSRSSRGLPTHELFLSFDSDRSESKLWISQTLTK